MAKYRYYGVKGDYAWSLASSTHPNVIKWWAPAIMEESDLVWCQGPKGGVRLVFYNWERAYETDTFRKHGYITHDSEAMSEFMWIKLKAVSLN